MSRARILADYVSSGDELADKLDLSGGAMTGAITTNSTFDGVDVATRDAILTSTTTLATDAAPKASPAFTGVATFPVGSESAPSITFTGDTDTGMFRPLANELDFVTAGNTGLHIGPTGNVGVGTEGPDYPLHTKMAANGYGIVAESTDGGEKVGMYFGGSNDAGIGTITDTSLDIFTNGGTRMTIDSDGIVTKPNQPAFSTYGTLYSQVTSSWSKIIPNGEYFDQGNNYTSGTFTAPVSGIYLFTYWGLHYPTSEAAVRSIQYRKDGSSVTTVSSQSVQGGGHSTDHVEVSGSWLVDLADSSYVDLWLWTSSGKAYAGQWHMSGHLLG